MLIPVISDTFFSIGYTCMLHTFTHLHIHDTRTSCHQHHWLNMVETYDLCACSRASTVNVDNLGFIIRSKDSQQTELILCNSLDVHPHSYLVTFTMVIGMSSPTYLLGSLLDNHLDMHPSS